jgi:type VI secretion system protein ImpK
MPDIDDPFKPSDATVLRPRPGGGRPGAVPSGSPFRRPMDTVAPAPYVEEISDRARELLGTGLNPLVQAATPVLVLAGQARGTLSVPDVAGLRRYALDAIRRFEERSRAAGIANETVLVARYALCAALDEAVLSTPWGAQSEWAQQTLLVVLHREAWGGEKFFEMLDRITRDPARHIDLMELQYLCLAFGFAGKYQVSQRGATQLAEVQHDLYRKIREHRGGTPPPELSLRWRGLQDRRNPLIRYVPWWVVGAATLGILALAFVFYYSRLGSAAAPVHTELAAVGLEDFTGPVPAASIQGPTLKQLLAADESRGDVSVEEDGGRTRVTMLTPNLFGSGSATVNPVHTTMLRRLAEAIDQVPGRVLVVGHTDDQPLRSFQYKDNFELSRERAVSVVRLLQPALANPSRVEYTGVGSSQPRYRPESDPANRARNRRVEIIHVRGA